MRAKTALTTYVATAGFGYLSRDFFTAFIPSAFGMLVYNYFTSSDTEWELWGKNPTALIFCRKSLVPLP